MLRELAPNEEKFYAEGARETSQRIRGHPLWNHRFYSNSMSPNEGGEPPVAHKRRIETPFGSVDACKKELAHAAVSQKDLAQWLLRTGMIREEKRPVELGSIRL
jgi:superoxide dismutase